MCKIQIKRSNNYGKNKNDNSYNQCNSSRGYVLTHQQQR
nr:MAG TPA: hypothetical protein [Caudoviricetes sp.]